MILTVAQLISLAIDTIGAMQMDETPKPYELTNGLTRLNMMMDAWSVDNLMVMGTLMESFPLTTGAADYTIGIGAVFNTPKPSAVTDAFIRDASNLDSGLDIVSGDEYNSYPDKDFSTGRPTSLYYDEGPPQQAVQTGVIWLYPIPDAAYTLFLGQQKALTEFGSQTDVVSFQTAYYEALLYNLALRLFRSYFKGQTPIPADIVELAMESKRVIERMNNERVHMACDFPGKRGGYNILTDQ